MRIPNAHQSTSFPWPRPWMISGARYSGVPHNVYVRLEENKNLREVFKQESSVYFISLALFFSLCFDSFLVAWQLNSTYNLLLRMGTCDGVSQPPCQYYNVTKSCQAHWLLLLPATRKKWIFKKTSAANNQFLGCDDVRGCPLLISTTKTSCMKAVPYCLSSN